MILLIIIVLLAGCGAPPHRYPPDPMATKCLVSDFSRHTDQELTQCQRWLAQRGGWLAPSQTYTVVSPNGTAFVTCLNETCTQIGPRGKRAP